MFNACKRARGARETHPLASLREVFFKGSKFRNARMRSGDEGKCVDRVAEQHRLEAGSHRRELKYSWGETMGTQSAANRRCRKVWGGVKLVLDTERGWLAHRTAIYFSHIPSFAYKDARLFIF